MASVSVACKLPNGLIIEHDGQKVRLNGSNSSQVIGGFGITHGIDQAFFDAWLAKSKEYDPVAKGMIWAHGKPNDTLAMAKEMATEKNGFEGLDPKKPGKDLEPATAE